MKNAIDLTNNYIATQHGNSNMFATVFFGLLDPTEGKLTYINAGHEAPLLFSEGRLKIRLLPTGPAVGMLPDMDFKTEWIMLKPGDSLLLFTDGVTDALNRSRELFSEERLIASAAQAAHSSMGMVQNITSSLVAHIGPNEQYDDITLLAVRRQ